MDDATRREVERWFRRRGLPHFQAGYSARRDVLTRSLPILTFVFLLEVMNAPNAGFPLWLDVLAVVGGFAILLGAWALVNRLRHRPALARPVEVGPVEMAVFVFVPAIIPIVFGRQFLSAAVTVVANIVILMLVYVGLSYGIASVVRWALSRVGAQLGAITTLLIRALPLMLLVVTFFFLTAEVWQSVGSLHGAAYLVVLGLFVAVGLSFTIARLPRDVADLGHFDSWAQVDALVAEAPAPTCTEPPDAPVPEEPLSRREWGNVGLVALVSQGVQIALVSTLIGAFYVVLGMFVISEQTTLAWLATDSVDVLVRFGFGGRDLVITAPLLRVAGFIAVFAGLQFTMSLLTDPAYRVEFREEVVAEIRQAFAVRARYRAALAEEPGAARPATIPPT